MRWGRGTVFLYGACSCRERFIPLRKTAQTASHILIKKFYFATNRYGTPTQLEIYMALSAQIGQMTKTGSGEISILFSEERQSLGIQRICLSLVALSIKEAQCAALLKGTAMPFRFDNSLEKSTTSQRTATQSNSKIPQQRSLPTTRQLSMPTLEASLPGRNTLKPATGLSEIF